MQFQANLCRKVGPFVPAELGHFTQARARERRQFFAAYRETVAPVVFPVESGVRYHRSQE